MKIKTALLIICVFLSSAEAAEDKDQKYSLFSQANEAFRSANAMTDNPQQAGKLFEKAILYYEKIINDYDIKNAKLYYNLANAYLMQNNLSNLPEGNYLGKAILNYRRAEKLDNSDTNIKKNLAFARSLRFDKIEEKTEKKIMHTLFFWHYDFAVRSRFTAAVLSFAIACAGLTLIIWRGKKPFYMYVTTAAALFFICFISSVIIETGIQQSKLCGVITAKQVVARQGDSENYPPSFKDPLHQGTEFDVLENRGDWLHIKLSDDSRGWIPDNKAEII